MNVDQHHPYLKIIYQRLFWCILNKLLPFIIFIFTIEFIWKLITCNKPYACIHAIPSDHCLFRLIWRQDFAVSWKRLLFLLTNLQRGFSLCFLLNHSSIYIYLFLLEFGSTSVFIVLEDHVQCQKLRWN